MKCGVTNSVYTEIRSTNSENPHAFEFIYECQEKNEMDSKSLHKTKLQMGRPTSHGANRAIYCVGCGAPVLHRHFEEAPF